MWIKFDTRCFVPWIIRSDTVSDKTYYIAIAYVCRSWNCVVSIHACLITVCNIKSPNQSTNGKVNQLDWQVTKLFHVDSSLKDCASKSHFAIHQLPAGEQDQVKRRKIYPMYTGTVCFSSLSWCSVITDLWSLEWSSCIPRPPDHIIIDPSASGQLLVWLALNPWID